MSVSSEKTIGYSPTDVKRCGYKGRGGQGNFYGNFRMEGSKRLFQTERKRQALLENGHAIVVSTAA